MSLYSDEQQAAPAIEGRVRGKTPVYWFVLVPLMVGVLIFGYRLVHRHSVSPGTVASAAGALSCDSSGYYITTAVSGKETVYDCSMASGKTLCVTYHGGIASDSTEIVRLAFANTLLTTKPSCLG